MNKINFLTNRKSYGQVFQNVDKIMLISEELIQMKYKIILTAKILDFIFLFAIKKIFLLFNNIFLPIFFNLYSVLYTVL